MTMMTKHLLVVDDEPAVRVLLQTLLEMYGYTSETAENGETAMSKLAQATYDAVLLDYMMPRVTGVTILHHLKQRHPSLPVVMVTGHQEGHVAEEALAAGARACLYKPLDFIEFENVLSEVLGLGGSGQSCWN